MPRLPSDQADLLDAIYQLLAAIPQMVLHFWYVELGLAVGLWAVMSLLQGRRRR